MTVDIDRKTGAVTKIGALAPDNLTQVAQALARIGREVRRMDKAAKGREKEATP